MAALRCKMCGAPLNFAENATVCECDSCGTQQTLPKLENDRKLNLCDRANHLRRNSEYDKAIAMYEEVLKEDVTDPEIYWAMVLCRYGVEYVKDPATGKQIPTINRMQYLSIFDDQDYKAALQHGDYAQRKIYETEAATINEIQKRILAICESEEPFDVFICFKESDNGKRTIDSTLANDIYYELTDNGFKVFYSPITLEDKLGTEYEPYIFAALNSAKVMIVVGTKPEYFQAPWVKNEWSRFLALIRNGEKKKLIPAYRDMDPYDMPEEFAHLQAQDMSKIGFVQQLIRGIKLLINKDTPAPAPVAAAPAAAPAQNNTADLLRRAKVFLEDENWNNAIQCAEEVIYAVPDNGEAHLYLLLAKNQVTTIAKLANYRGDSLENDKYFRNAMKYGTAATQKSLTDANDKFKAAKLKIQLDKQAADELVIKRRQQEEAIRRENALRMEEEARLEQEQLAYEAKVRLAVWEAKKKKMVKTVVILLIIGLIMGIGGIILMPKLTGGFTGGNMIKDGVRYVKEGDYVVLSEKSEANDIPKDFTIPGQINDIPVKEVKNALKYTKIETLVIEEGVEIIGASAFESCTKLKSVTLPASIKSIGTYAFFSCDGVETFTFGGTMAQWEAIEIGDSAFGFSSIKTIICSDGTIERN